MPSAAEAAESPPSKEHRDRTRHVDVAEKRAPWEKRSERLPVSATSAGSAARMKQGSPLLGTSGGPDVAVPEGRRPRAVPELTPRWLPCLLGQRDGDRVEARRPPDRDTRCTKRLPGRRAPAFFRLALSAPTKPSKRVGGCAGALLSGTSSSRIGEEARREFVSSGCTFDTNCNLFRGGAQVRLIDTRFRPHCIGRGSDHPVEWRTASAANLSVHHRVLFCMKKNQLDRAMYRLLCASEASQ